MANLKLSTYLRRIAQTAGVAAILIWGSASAQDDYARQWAPPVGTAMPALMAPDQSGMERSLQDLTGEQGLLLFLNRSADW